MSESRSEMASTRRFEFKFQALLAVLLVVQCRIAIADEAVQVSFQHDVLPILTKMGCNAGTCHGAPSGKNGFRLSLRGFDPALDIAALTREVQARRVNRFQPGDSLILLKATAQVPHEGGRRFRTGSDFYNKLRDWIAQGGRDDSSTAPRLSELELTPARLIIDAPTDSQQLQVLAGFEDGSRRDVTHLARFTVNDESVAEVSAGGRVHKLRRGEVTVSAEYCNDFTSATLVFREPDPKFNWPDPKENNYVDRHVLAKLKLLRIEPSLLSSDEEFVRRVHLDVMGSLPTPDEVRTFLSDTDPDRRGKLIEELLERPEFADWWALKWTDRLGCNQRFVGKAGAIKYHRWIRHAMAVNMPEDEFVRTILTASGPNYSIPSAGFWRRLRKGGIGSTIDPLLAAEETSQLFLGVRIQCARCHNHPAERWTQNDYYGLAAFFPRLRFKDGPFFNGRYDKEDTVYETREGEVTHPRTGQAVAPKLLGAQLADVTRDGDRRAVLARWLVAADNPFFARAAVNRIWYHLFGRGIVEPVDDFRGSNPASNKELLQALTADFVRHGFDRKHLIRTILHSGTYQAGSQTTPTNATDEKYFSHARIRLLQAEQLLDAICQAAGAPENFPGLPLGTRAVALPDGEYKHPFLEAFGRPARAMACECERDPNTNLSQALQLVSGRFVHDKIHSENGRAAKMAASRLTEQQIIEELFLATLSRYPSQSERKLLAKQIDAPTTDRRKAIEDLLWTLLNHEEFLFQH